MEMQGTITRADGSVLTYVRNPNNPEVASLSMNGRPWSVSKEIKRQFEGGQIKK